MVYELLKKRRSIRKFKNQEVEEEKIRLILNSGLLAPSSRSRRPWEFIVIRDKEVLQKLSGCREHGAGFVAGAPLLIVVLADPDACDVWIEDSSIAAILMQLEAQDLGLGSCWIQIRERFDAKKNKAEANVREILAIPQKYTVECMVAIGYPDEEKSSYEEGSLLNEKIHYNQF